MKYRNFVLVSLGLAALCAMGCASCHSCGNPWFSKFRRCDPPCTTGGAPIVAAPAGAVIAPPPGAVSAPPPGAVVVPSSTSNLGPTPDVVVPARIETNQQPFFYNGRRYYY